ncbi:MAG: MoaD/ThiS family protein [Anaerolineae bacterium]|nr:MoaD/ThiS family protein [Anaerolineae bacterium]
MATIRIDVWLYGALAHYGGNPDERVFANPQVSIPEGSALRDLLKALKMDTQERGITFINGDLSAMPGIQPDLDHPLKDGDRVAFFHLQSMWPFQYRHGVGMIAELQQAMLESEDSGLHHTYQSGKES